MTRTVTPFLKGKLSGDLLRAALRRRETFMGSWRNIQMSHKVGGLCLIFSVSLRDTWDRSGMTLNALDCVSKVIKIVDPFFRV